MPLTTEARSGAPVVMIDVSPGMGLVDLYGDPNQYTVQANSRLRNLESAQSGSYAAPDLYSGRRDRVRRAFAALHADQDHARMQVWVDGSSVLKSSDGAKLLDDALERFGLTVEDGSASLYQFWDCLAGALCTGEGATLLASLLRAQSGAGGSTGTSARYLLEVLSRHSGDSQAALHRSLSERDALATALLRGFWTLAADESGMHSREREGERLLERARRELWAEGSASRKELEEQIRKFLAWHLIGLAATDAKLRLTLVRSDACVQSQDGLRDVRFAPITGMKGMWIRVELLEIEVPPGNVIALG